MNTSYTPTWTSLSSHPFPAWLRDAKFGIYTHWGPYSVAGYGGNRRYLNGSWYARHMYLRDGREYEYHCEHYGKPSPTFGYKDLIPLFKAEKFDPEAWADLFRRSGARFAGPVAAHHDNFAMWDSAINPWNAARMGPCRDVAGELAGAIRAAGMKFIATFHNAYNWWFFPKDEAFDTLDQAGEMLYSRRRRDRDLPDRKYHEDWLAINGEAIYGTVPWIHAGEGPTVGSAGGDFTEGEELRFNSADIRYTAKGNSLYAICLGRPGERLTLRAFMDRTYDAGEVLTGTGPIRNAQYLYPEDRGRIGMLGHDGPLPWRFDEDGLQVELPERVPSDIAVALRIEMTHDGQDVSGVTV